MDNNVKAFLESVRDSAKRDGTAWKAVCGYFGTVSEIGAFEDSVKLLYSEVTLGAAELKIDREDATLAARVQVSAFGVLFRIPKAADNVMITGLVKVDERLGVWRSTLADLPEDQQVAIGEAKSKSRQHMNKAKAAGLVALKKRYPLKVEASAESENGEVLPMSDSLAEIARLADIGQATPQGLALHDAFNAGARDVLIAFGEHIRGITNASDIKKLLADPEWIDDFVLEVTTPEVAEEEMETEEAVA